MYHQWNEWYGTIRYDMVWYHGPPSVSPGAHSFGSRTRGGRRQGKSASVVPCKKFLLKISLVLSTYFAVMECRVGYHTYVEMYIYT